jgi:hypothetical protein
LLGRGLGGGVGRERRNRLVLGRRKPCGSAVDLARGDHQDSGVGTPFPYGVEQVDGADDVDLPHLGGPLPRLRHPGAGGEVNNRAGIRLRETLLERPRLQYVGLERYRLVAELGQEVPADEALCAGYEDGAFDPRPPSDAECGRR